MLTKRYFTVWDPATLSEGGQPPDYKLPYKELFLWLAILGNLAVTAAVGVAAGFVISFLAGLTLPGWVQAALVVAYIVTILSCVAWAVFGSYVFWWDWLNRPYVVSADDANLRIIQDLDESRMFLKPFVPSSGDELIDLSSEEYETPERPWLFRLLVPYNIIVVPRRTTMSSAFRIVDVVRRYRRNPESMSIYYVQNMAHITAIVTYVKKMPRKSLQVQTDSLSRMPEQLGQLLQLQAGTDGVLSQILEANIETNKLLRELIMGLRHSSPLDEAETVVIREAVDPESPPSP